MNDPYEIIFFFRCGWIKNEKNECLVPVMFPDHTQPAPDALLEMIWCNCATDIPCSRRSCSCTNVQLSCTSSANVIPEPVSTAAQYRKTVTTKEKTNSNLKMENNV